MFNRIKQCFSTNKIDPYSLAIKYSREKRELYDLSNNTEQMAAYFVIYFMNDQITFTLPFQGRELCNPKYLYMI